MKFSKPVLRWIIGIALSAVFLLLAYPWILFTAGPIGALCAALYAVFTVVWGIVALRSNRPVMKRVLKIALIVPPVLWVVMLILINTYWFHLC